MSITTDLEAIYRAYIDCIDAQNWADLPQFVADDVQHNGRPLGLQGYRALLEEDFRQIPDLRFHIALLVIQPPFVACRLRFEVTPVGRFLDLPINGRRVTFCENVFYEFRDGKIWDVQSIIDKLAIEAQIRG